MSSLPFKVKAVYEYSSPHEDDLHFPNGQIITVVEEEDDDWYVGEYVDASGVKQEGLFPKNFVEKYEPTAPPRPTRASRPKKEAEPIAAALPVAEPSPREQISHGEEDPEEVQEAPAPQGASPPAPKAQAASPTISRPAEPSPPPPAASKPAPPSSKPSAPPPVSDKPSGGSFRDRIAAFNKAAVSPVAPFKPGGLSSGGSGFIKKPFVAPPPSKNAYVPPPREPAPHKIYRREEDPEIAAREAEDRENAEKAGLVPTSQDEDAENLPKPTSLKERIALLQKQQMEQANRHAEAAQKKEKPKRPPKKRMESHGPSEAVEEGEVTIAESRDAEETAGKHSIDSLREDVTEPRRRRSSRGAVATPGLHPRRSFGDGNDADMSGAGDTTEEPEEISTGRDDSDDKPRTRPPPPARAPTHERDLGEGGASEEGEGEEEDEEEEEDDIDPEIRRKEELRARMAKMSGGMGMYGMFGPPGGMPLPGSSVPPKKKKPSSEKRPADYGTEDPSSPSTRAPPVPMIPLPGMTRVRSPEEVNKQLGDDSEKTPISSARPVDEVMDFEDVVPGRSHEERGASPPVPSHEGTGAPPVPGGRPGPPPVPKESRPVVPPTSSIPMSPSAGSESDDEMSEHAQKPTVASPTAEPLSQGGRPPPPLPSEALGTPLSPTIKRNSYFGTDQGAPSSPITPGPNKRASRVPPIPGAVISSQGRAPPPPPPNAPLSPSSTGDQRVLPSPKYVTKDEIDEEVTEYEGDYDTDIASTVPHKDALKSHARELFMDDNTPLRSPLQSPSSIPPPLPPQSAPRAAPPPLPSQPPSNSRKSSEMPRAAPPPPPPSKGPIGALSFEEEDEYDPYRYTELKIGAPSFGAPTPTSQKNEEDLYSASPPRSYASLPQERAAPPPPPRDAAPASSIRALPRQSSDVQRSANVSRRSTDLSRMSLDSGFVATDVDLAQGTRWWTQLNGTPPAFQNRKDILYESEETTSSKRGGKTVVTKDLYVLFQDYSQTVITAKFDAQDPSDVSLEQRHESPPSRLRQDQLEQAHELFGRRISEAVTTKKDTVVGDGSPQDLVQELLKPFADALLPVGTRAYGALVYGNLANASTQQNDEIRPGDIITLRNTKFQGKHGPMHAKYSMEVGKPDHVGIVAEWDGTKKKVRAWEQGRESKKVKLESFKLDDLRSGEVKIWRVMPRSWVGWEGQN